jgi:hypothetical protein
MTLHVFGGIRTPERVRAFSVLGFFANNQPQWRCGHDKYGFVAWRPLAMALGHGALSRARGLARADPLRIAMRHLTLALLRVALE